MLYLPRSVYILRIPFASQLGVLFSMVYHIRTEGNRLVQRRTSSGDNDEIMVAFIAGLNSTQISEALMGLAVQWQDVARDHMKTSARLTPRLLIARILSQCESIISLRTIDQSLKGYDRQLQIYTDLLNAEGQTFDNDTIKSDSKSETDLDRHEWIAR